MAVETTQQIVREAPEVEAYKLGLLESAKGLADQRVTLPTQQVAGLSPMQLRALQMASPASGGIGGYQQYLNQAGQTLSGATPYIEGAVGSAQPLLSGARDTAQPFITQGAAEGAERVRRQRGDPFITGGFESGSPMISDAAAASRPFIEGAMGRADPLVSGAVGEGTAGFRSGASAVTGGDISQYMNPYQQAVQDEINRSFDMQQAQLDAGATKAGAFGGSRAAIQSAEIGRNRAQALAQSQAQNFLQAQKAAENQRQRQLASAQGIGALGLQGGRTLADVALQSGRTLADVGLRSGQALGQLGLQTGQALSQADLARGQALANIGLQTGRGLADIDLQSGQALGQLGLQAASGLGQLGVQQAGIGELAQQTGLRDIQTQFGLGKQQQAQQQAVLEAQRKSELAQLYEPYQRLGFLSDIYRGAPTSQQTISQVQRPDVSPAQQLLGLGVAGLSAYGGAKQAGLFG